VAINIAKQLFGTNEGRKIENAEDNVLKPIPEAVADLAEALAVNAGDTFLSSKGFPPTPAGAIAYADSVFDNAITTAPLPQNVKATLVVLLNSLAAAAEAAAPKSF
jgi:hypothetical protein